MKKVLFISDTLAHDAKDPISNMVNQFLRLEFFKDSQKAIIEPRTNIFEKFKEEKHVSPYGMPYVELLTPKINGGGLYLRKPLPCKIKYLLYKILNKLHLKKADDYFVDYLKRARKIFKFDFACFCVNSPKINVTRWLNSKNIPYVFFMHSTWIDDPRFRSEDIYPIENEIIKGSYKYFVPSFFFKKYKNTYNHKQLQPYNLPLLIDKKDVLDAYKHQTSNKQYDFAYFGALQTFRNERKIFDIFKKMNAKIDVFCYDNFESHLAVIKHNAVSEKEFLNALSSSRFLVIFDNSAPFNHYLPSKCYTYVSFCKPIIVFGDNEKSATIDFLKDYPYYFYQKIGQDIDGLLNFINTFSSIEIEYDEKIYSKYKKYSPHDSLLNINTILMENQK